MLPKSRNMNNKTHLEESSCGAYSHNHKDHSLADGHSHAISYNKKFAFGITLNIIYITIELYYGKILGSSALMADGLHNFTDVIGLIIAWLGFFLAGKKSNRKFTFGLKNATILASFINAVTVFIGVVYIIIEACHAFFSKTEILANEVMLVAGIGILINGITAALFFAGSKEDLNIKGAFLHLLFDAVVSLGVVISGLIIMITGFSLVDSITSFIIAAIIVVTTWSFFMESIKLIFNGVPSGILIEEIEKALLQIEGINSFHDLHVWAISTNQNALSVHINFSPRTSIITAPDLLKKIQTLIIEKFNISHTTIQIEEVENCSVDC
jgi:cobalt-zinc-cadmium efflux system protein